MFLQKRKRVCLNIEEKLWILNSDNAEGIPNKFSKIARIVEIAQEVPLKVGKRCWRVSLYSRRGL